MQSPLHHEHHQWKSAEGAGVEPARLSLNRLPTGSRHPSGCPSDCFSSPTRIRTRNTSVETRDDLRFTIGPKSGRHGIRTHMTRRSRGLADRPGEPYPATFRMSVDPPRVELGSPPRQSGVFPLDHEPEVDRMGIEPTAPTLQGSVAPMEHASPFVERSVRELNPILRPTKAACCRNTYRPSVRSDPGWNRTIDFLVVTQASLPLDHGIVESRV